MASEATRLDMQQADRQRVPDGWKLVPVDPTQEMMDAAMAYVYKYGFTRGSGPGAVYAAMLNAAPEAPGQAVVQVPQDFESVYSKALKESRPGTLKDIARLCYEAALAAAPEAPAQKGSAS